MIGVAATVLLLALYCSPALGAECHGSPSADAKMNLNPILTGPPVFVSSVKNAKMYTVGDADDLLPIVHLWGTPYDMGYAHGLLRNETMINMINSVWSYLEGQAESAINGSIHGLRPWFVDLLAELGLDGALEATLDATRPYSGDYFQQEMQGMADATNIPIKKILHIHMIGEVTKGGCSMFGAWGSATASTGSLLQLRALDWDVDGPFKNFPQITVYHPPASGEYGHDFANIGWTGWVGSITGISSAQVAISEIGVSFPDSTFGEESRFGVPFTYILRDILQFDDTIGSAEARLRDAHRTCDLIFGVGDGKSGIFRGVQYSAAVANFYTDTDNMPEAPWHPRMDNVVYYGMDWLCPGYSLPLYNQLTKYHGNITAANTVLDIVPIVQTGDLHIAIYDLTNMILTTANARRDGVSGPAMAYDRSFIQIDMKAVFAVQPPSL